MVDVLLRLAASRHLLAFKSPRVGVQETRLVYLCDTTAERAPPSSFYLQGRLDHQTTASNYPYDANENIIFHLPDGFVASRMVPLGVAWRRKHILRVLLLYASHNTSSGRTGRTSTTDGLFLGRLKGRPTASTADKDRTEQHARLPRSLP